MATPDWFTKAIADQPEVHTVKADVPIRVRSWGRPESTPLVLIHGGGAHAHWWDPMGPILARQYRVLAVDLSGHGDSGWRSEYTVESWTNEIEQVLDSDLIQAPPILVGHSMAGLVLGSISRRPHVALRGMIFLDTEFTRYGVDLTRPEWAAARGRARRFYDTKAEILAKFRTLPADSEPAPYVMAYLAETSIIEVDGQWTWKFDPAFFSHDFIHLDDLQTVDYPVAVARGEWGLVPDGLAREIATRLGSERSPIVVADSGHHVLVEQPLQVAAIISSLASEWHREANTYH